MRAQIAELPDGRRHFHDGPIDLILHAVGGDVERAYAAGAARFASILDELCGELPRLRAARGPQPLGTVARRMVEAIAPFAEERFLTPMAAVAGAVAEEVLQAMVEAAPLARAYVNNGGDIALFLAPVAAVADRGRPRSATAATEGVEAFFDIGLIARPDQPRLIGKAHLSAHDPERGVATSGWRGRSFSLGIADSVTVIARNAARADAAATLIANAVDLPCHPAVTRAPANSRDPQSDLGDRRVTLDVGPLAPREIDAALLRGAREAEHWRRRGLISSAALSLQGETRLVGAATSLYSIGAAAPFQEPRHALG